MNKKDRKEIALINDILDGANDRILKLKMELELKQASIEKFFPDTTPNLEREINDLECTIENIDDAIQILKEVTEV